MSAFFFSQKKIAVTKIFFSFRFGVFSSYENFGNSIFFCLIKIKNIYYLKLRLFHDFFNFRNILVNQRQKSVEVMDAATVAQARTLRLQQTGNYGYQRLKERSMSVPARLATIDLITNTFL